MSVDKLVDSTQLDADLTSVANAIRTKGGTSAALAFPADFVSAIQAIPTGGGTSGVLTYDFTKSLVDQETGLFPFVLSGSASRDSSGLHLTGSGGKAAMRNIDLHDHVVEIEIGETDFKGGISHGRFVMSTDGMGLIYRGGANWAIYNGGWTSNYSADKDWFENTTLTIEFSSAGSNNVNMYRNGVQFVSDISFGTLSDKTFYFGSDSTSFYDSTILSCTIYTAEAYALKILMGS